MYTNRENLGFCNLLQKRPNITRFGTGDLEITIRNEEDLTKAEPLILKRS